MDQRDTNLVTSRLSRRVTKHGVTVEVNIVRLEQEAAWSLEVLTADGASTVWNEQFASDEEAYAEFVRTVSEEGIRTFLDEGNVLPFRR